MRQVFEVVVLDQLIDVMDRIAVGTNTRFTRAESVGYKSGMREAIARIVSKSVARATSGYEFNQPSTSEILADEQGKEKATIDKLFSSTLLKIVGRMPKKTYVYMEGIGKAEKAFVIIVSDKPVKSKSPRILP